MSDRPFWLDEVRRFTLEDFEAVVERLKTAESKQDLIDVRDRLTAIIESDQPRSLLHESCTREGCTGSRTQHGPRGLAMIRCPLTQENRAFLITAGTVHYTGRVECPFMEEALAR